MNVITYQGERNLSEVTNRLFTRLTPRQREKAEAAILKANPQLKNIRRVPRGTVLEVPELPELQAKRKRNPENPKIPFDKQVAESLDAFSKHFSERTSSDRKETKTQLQLLKSRQFKTVIAANSHLKDRARDVTRSLTSRVTEVEERNKTVQLAIKQIMKDL